MASLSRDKNAGVYRIHFRFAGKQYQKSLKVTDRRKAEGLKGRIELTLLELEQGRKTLPPAADLWEFLRSDGQRSSKLQPPDEMTLGRLFDWYLDSLPNDNKESNTRQTEVIHARHLKRLLGVRTRLDTITGQRLQEDYVNRRVGEVKYGRLIKSVTVRKEIATLRMVWNRANRLGLISSKAPTEGLAFPKGREKPPFQTWAEIERAVGSRKLTEEEQREQWDSLFLDLNQVVEVLEFVRARPTRKTYFYPALVFAAHTGARLSEILRSQVEDFQFDGGTVLIREKKRDRSQWTTRRVPLTPLLTTVIQTYWATDHPGGRFTIARSTDMPMKDATMDAAFEWFFRDSKWRVLRGYHVFRHSFASNLARHGADERVIDELMGHETEAMRRRYRHLFPEQRANAVSLLYG